MKSKPSNKTAAHYYEYDTESTRIRAAQVQLLYRQGHIGLFSALLLALVMTATFWNAVSHSLLVAWLACSAVIYMARYGLVLAFFKASPVGGATIPWGTWSAVGNLVTGLLWGASAVLIFPNVSETYQTVLCFFLGAIGIGTVTVYFPRKEVYTPFVLAVGLPLAGIQIHQGGSVHVIMGGLTLVYVTVLIIAGNRMQSTLTTSLKLGFENQDLVQSLREEKAATEVLNESLRAEIRERKKARDQIKASLKEKEVLLREIHHRVKNNLAVISSLLSLQSGYATDESHRKMFEDAEARVRSMAMAHEKLYQSESLAALDIPEYVNGLADHLIDSTGLGYPLEIRKDIEDVSFGIDTAIPLGFILTELLSNCLKHAFPDGREGEIRIVLRSVGAKEFELVVSDNGVGMPKDIDLENPESLGWDLVNAFADKIKGTIEIQREEGTEVRVEFRELRQG